MFYNGYHFFGMHLSWWIFWIVLLMWIFATPYYIPGQQKKKKSALNLLQERFALGEISKETYEEHKAILEKYTVK
jgi:putative membrane protein